MKQKRRRRSFCFLRLPRICVEYCVLIHCMQIEEEEEEEEEEGSGLAFFACEAQEP